jgi:transcriptional regulator with XRE-family HTH domain
MEHGLRIASLRDKMGLTQEELANKVGITRASLSHYENNRREPDYETIHKFADFFKVSIDYLMGRSDDPKGSPDNGTNEFVSDLELSNEAIMEKYSLMIDGSRLTPEETKRFIAFIRAERSFND